MDLRVFMIRRESCLMVLATTTTTTTTTPRNRSPAGSCVVVAPNQWKEPNFAQRTTSCHSKSTFSFSPVSSIDCLPILGDPTCNLLIWDEIFWQEWTSTHPQHHTGWIVCIMEWWSLCPLCSLRCELSPFRVRQEDPTYIMGIGETSHANAPYVVG